MMDFLALKISFISMFVHMHQEFKTFKIWIYKKIKVFCNKEKTEFVQLFIRKTVCGLYLEIVLYCTDLKVKV